jgi:phosphopantetheinyl transferase (holo-ACP synthase)
LEIIHDANGRPVLNLKNNALNLVRELGLKEWSVSISHSRQYALATVTFIGE